jgi:hypothetical protein
MRDYSIGRFPVMLHQFVTINRNQIIARYHAQVRMRSPESVSTVKIDNGIGPFLAQLVKELRPGLSSSSEMLTAATQQAHELLCNGFSISQVLRHYSDMCQTITDLALEEGALITVQDARVLNRCLDDAIAGVVTEHGRTREAATMTPAVPGRGGRIASLGRDLRESIDTARVALRAVKSGRVGLAGSTGTVIDRNLLDAHDLVERLVAILEAQVGARPH